MYTLVFKIKTVMQAKVFLSENCCFLQQVAILQTHIDFALALSLNRVTEYKETLMPLEDSQIHSDTYS